MLSSPRLDIATTTATAAAAPARRPLIYYGYWIVGAALVAQFVCAGTQAYTSGIFLQPMTEDLGWTRAEFAYAQTFGRFVTAFAGFFLGVYIDRFGGRALMVIGVTLVGVGLFLTSAVTELWQWVLVRGFLSMLGAALMGNLVVNVTLSKWFVEKRGRVVGVAATGVSLAGVVMPALLTSFVDEFGWRAGWRILAIFAWALVYPVAMLMRRQPEDYGLHPDGKSEEEVRAGGAAAAAADLANSLTRRQALRTSAFYVIVISFGFGLIGVGVMLFGLIPFLTDEGFSRSTAALMVTAMSIPAVAAKPIWGWVIDFIQPKLAAAAGFATSAIAIVVILFSAKAGSVPGVTVGSLLMGLGYGGTIPIQEVIWATYFGRRHLGSVRGVAMPFALILGAGGPLVVQIYFDRVGNYDGAFLAIAASWALGTALILTARKPATPSQPPPDGPPPSEPPPDGGMRRGDGASAAPPAAALSGDGSAAVDGADGTDGTDGAAPAAQPTVGATPVRRRAPVRDYMSSP